MQAIDVVSEGSNGTTRRLLFEVAERLRANQERWPRLPPADDTGRSFARLGTAAGWDAWLIRWEPGARIAFHDHGEAAGVAYLVYGALAELVARPDLGSGLHPVEHRLLTVNTRGIFPPGHVHSIENPFPGPALSVNVYAPRLESMNFFERVSRPLVDTAIESVSTVIAGGRTQII